MTASREKSRDFHDATAHTLAALKVDNHILIQDPDTSRWSIPGKVIEVGPNRDYLVRTENGKEFRQNRRHLLCRRPRHTQKQREANRPHQLKIKTSQQLLQNRQHKHQLMNWSNNHQSVAPAKDDPRTQRPPAINPSGLAAKRIDANDINPV
jgi:hypothetical protein